MLFQRVGGSGPSFFVYKPEENKTDEMDGPQDCPKQICPEPPVYLPGGFSVARLQKSDLKP